MPTENAGIAASAEQPYRVLTPKCPSPYADFEPLSSPLVHKLIKYVMEYLRQLCEDRGATIHFEYWKEHTRAILSAKSCEETIIVPARAGSGKSTWILAFLLALCDFHINKPEQAQSLGGILMVVQKVETLNEMLDSVRSVFPKYAEELVTVLQGWSKSGQAHGFCPNTSVQTFDDCQQEQCAYAANCKILSFQNKASSAFILGMTQARFTMLRSATGGLQNYLTRTLTDSSVCHRRFLIFDEKFEMVQESILNQQVINTASSVLEKRGSSQGYMDSNVQHIQRQFSYHVRRPYEELRQQTVYASSPPIDKPFGLCRLSDNSSGFLSFSRKFEGKERALVRKDLKSSLDVITALYRQECLFCKIGGFSILHTMPPCTIYRNTQTIIFDATAKADGDYLHLPGARLLNESPALHMERVTFHVFWHPSMNVSRSAMKKPWKLPAFTALIEDILTEFPTRTFLCAYKDHAQYLPDKLSQNALQYLSLMSGQSGMCLPYFGGTNGSNGFNDCTNVILLGYPRLDPQTYLFRTYGAWGDHGFSDELDRVSANLNERDSNVRGALRELPSLKRYESMHIAARLEQEIYRCALRNHVCNEDINIFLFAPSESVWKLLHERFPGSRVNAIDALPACFAQHKNRTRIYDGKPTAYHRLSDFIASWDGEPIKSSVLRENLEISQSVWSDLLKDTRTHHLLDTHEIIRTGRGANTTWQIEAEIAA